jgi:hypothetical protein
MFRITVLQGKKRNDTIYIVNNHFKIAITTNNQSALCGTVSIFWDDLILYVSCIAVLYLLCWSYLLSLFVPLYSACNLVYNINEIFADCPIPSREIWEF